MPKETTSHHMMSNILLIDDEPVIYDAVRMMFPEYPILYATSGQEGCQYLQDNKSTLNLVLLDYRLKNTNGLLVFDKLQEINPQITIIMITAMSSLVLKQAMEKGAFAVIDKPIDYNDLQAVIWEAQQLSASG